MQYKVVDPDNEENVLAEGETDFVPSTEMGSFHEWWTANGQALMEETDLPEDGSQRRVLFVDDGQVVHSHTLDW